ncbi:MAG: UMP kinase [Methanobacteriota archaeon]
MKTVVVSIGGSVLLSKEADPDFLKKLAILLQKISAEYKLYIVVGGGRVARDYIHLGRTLGIQEDTLDSLGIDITRVNAKLLANLLQNANSEIPQTTDEAKNLKHHLIIMGGTTPGHSTDMVSAELAEKTKATRFINATNVDGIYDKDPNKYPDARQLKVIHIDELIQKYGTAWKSAGKHIAIDAPSLEIIKRAGLTTLIVNGRRLDQLEKAITGQPFDGTTIQV